MNHKLSVLMPTYNVEKYVGEAIESILKQTYTDFDFIIVDDGSTDSTVNIIKEYAANDSRIKFSQNEKNEGIIETRNKLFDMSNHEYMAMMDSDDIAHPQRFEKQVQFLDEHDDFGLVSSNIEIIPINTTTNRTKYNNHLRERMIFNNVINNPVSMFKSKYIKEHNIQYDPEVRGASDFKFWIELLSHTKGFILKDCLLQYRHHGSQESTSNRSRQKNNHVKVTHYQLKKIDETITPKEVERLLFPRYLLKNEKLKLLQTYKRLLALNSAKLIYSKEHFDAVIQKQIINLVNTEQNIKLAEVLSLKDIFLYPKISFALLSNLFNRKKKMKTHPTFHAQQIINELQQKDCHTVSIYGTGEITEALLHFININELNIKIENLFDIKAQHSEYVFHERVVSTPKTISEINHKTVIISSYLFKDEILKNLQEILKDDFKNYTFILSKG